MSRRLRVLSGPAGVALMAGLALAITHAAEGQVAGTAEAPAGTPQPHASPLQLPAVTVETDPANTLQRATGIGRLPGTVQDTPQTINVIPRAVLEQQRVTTLQEALRNVPGITASIGEGNGGVNGDQLRIRGFSGQNDIYVDGLRDFGSYTRDAFTYESVSVLKGPSGNTFGQNTAGGAVNVQTRLPHLGNEYGAVATGGTGNFYRGSVDINQQISETAAVRLNLMGQSSEAVDRDEVRSRRWGIAPSIAFGLGTDTTFSVDYLHLEDDRVPDYGVPVVTAPGTSIGRPVTEFGVPRSNWYGFGLDRDDVTVDRVTARLRHQANDWLTLHNDSRVGFVTRDFAASPTSCAAACVTALFDGNPATIPTVQASGAGSPFHQETWGAQNVTTAVADFTFAGFRNQATAGFDAWIQRDERTGYSYSPSTRPFVSLYDPSHSSAGYSVVPSTAANATRETEQRHLGVFFSERLWLTPQLSIVGGVRISNYDVDYTTSGPTTAPTRLAANDTFIDPRGALIWEPTQSQTYYFSYAESTSPPGSFITTQPGSFNANTSALDPERNRIYEVGAKFSLLDNRLGLFGAVFQNEKGNAFETDPVSGTTVQSGDRQRVRGVELGATGQITRDWSVTAAYSYFDSETTRSSTATNEGKRVAFVPEHAASVWTTYEAFRGTAYNMTLGGGVTYRGQVYLNAGNTSEVGESFSLDALASHSFGENNRFRVSVNGYNLTDELNYDTLFGNRVVPGAGRTVLFSLAVTY
ncbi:TonB-dependent receptor [Falsiroseomonas selenitidurans]|uniref:TonB-dependent siderophore receptor n=1 Tax=Falsiroseomonas selenitidurans TaxID=2716335 RepID=A0ABX1E305_9PROT|nr:TonB-dependent siderophore receptor [Falsiroseomonas selenitidurans]NKC31554.1 TonB-dependent siderophore receptor [Falsiroseomonas selenitidurans]